MSKSNDKPKQDAAKRKKELPALAKAALFVLGVVIFTVLVLLFYKAQIDNFNAWSGLGFPVYDGAESVKTISIAVFAIFSLMAVLWRSIISASQVKELQEQGRRTEKQIEQTEVKNLTELFTKGVELINTPEPEKNSALVLAGVSILHQVAFKQNGLFRKQVEDILAKNFLENATIDKNSPPYMWAAIEAYNKIKKYHYIHEGYDYWDNVTYYDEILHLNNRIYINKCIFSNNDHIFQYVSNIFFKKCDFYSSAFNEEIAHQVFIDCSFNYCDIDFFTVVGNTYFKKCKIKELQHFNEVSEFGYNIYIDDEKYNAKYKMIFEYCDFTHCKNIEGVAEVIFIDCQYDPKNPPVEPLKTLIDEANAKTAQAKASAESEDTTSTNTQVSMPTNTSTNDDKQG